LSLDIVVVVVVDVVVDVVVVDVAHIRHYLRIITILDTENCHQFNKSMLRAMQRMLNMHCSFCQMFGRYCIGEG